MKKFLGFIFISFLCFSLPAQTYRYTHQPFNEVNKIENVVYASSPRLNPGLFFNYNQESSTTITDLKMDIHLPVGDTTSLRPAIICVHGGAFLLGHKNHDDMMAFCDTFALKGYVTATINYRLGMNILDKASTTRAVYRGLQDGRAAVRFLRANAEVYGIDPTRIYMLGSSAGAFIALQDIYMDEEAEKPSESMSYQFNDPLDFIPPFTQLTAPDLGAYDIGNHLEQNGKPDAVIALWGAIQHTDLVTSENSTPVFLIHGIDDATVPFGIGNPFNVPIFQATYGSFEIDKKLDSLNILAKENYFVTNADHEFYGVFNGMWSNGTNGNAYWDTIVSKASSFLYQQHKPNAEFSLQQNYLEVSFEDFSDNALSWNWNFGDSVTSSLQNPTHTFQNEGTFLVSLYIENEIKSWDTLSRIITVTKAPTYTTNFFVSDGELPVSSASVEINDQVLITNTGGQASINLENGVYPFSVSAEGYIKLQDSLVILNSDQTVQIDLTKIEPPSYQISFAVANNGNAIQNAQILINDQTLLTNTEGMAEIYLKSGIYPHSIHASGYQTYTDTLRVSDENQVLNINLSLITGVEKLITRSFKLFPNPASQFVHLKINTYTKNLRLQLLNLTGEIIYDWEMQNGNFVFSVSDLSSGIYMVKVFSETEISVRKLIVH